MTNTAMRAGARSTQEGGELFGWRDWLLLILASVLACLVFVGVGRWLGIPAAVGYEPTVFGQRGAVVNLVLVGLLLSAVVAINTFIVRSARQDAGFFTACIGLAVLSIRFGEVEFAYRAAETDKVFLLMAVETVAWFLLVAAAWCVQWWFYRIGLVRGDSFRDQMEDPDHPIGFNILGTLTHAAAMCLLMLLLARSDDKGQAIAAVGLSSFLATLMAHSLFNATPSVWMWASPMIVGVLGFCLAYGQSGEGEEWRIGLLAQPLARATPLDYASVGPVGAVLGYWMSRKWHAHRQQQDVEARKTIGGYNVR